jgi:Zn-dependent metalloprotease
MLEGIILNGSEEQRASALETLQEDMGIRIRRAEVARMRRPYRLFGASRRRVLLRELLGFDLSGRRRATQEATLERTIYTANNRRRLPGKLAREEGDDPTGDPAVDEAYDYLGATYDLFFDEYNRNSLDDEGMELIASVHYARNYDNAFWNGEQMVFGDGRIFNRFTSSVDVIGHELSHGVTELTAGFRYVDQSGALNESTSDVFGILVKQRFLGLAADESDWLIGKELVDGTGINGVALRSMSEPGTAYDDPILGGKDPQPGHMDDYVETNSDNGGVHINSGIPNHAFYLAATAIGGNAWEEAGLVWYEALISEVTPNQNFAGWAELTIETAARLFGANDIVPQAFEDAWIEVGVLT